MAKYFLSERYLSSPIINQNKAYINGATALVSVKTMRAPKRSSTSTIGSNQYFFLIFRNSQNSVIID
jgi:hypothetical protein